MCMHGRMGPPYGIPIPEAVHDQYSDELKAAWTKFHAWWTMDRDHPARRGEMPDGVAAAMQLICETPIPGMERATGEDSCYMHGVEAAFEQAETLAAAD